MGLGHSDLLRGTLDMLALKALSVGPIHGWGLALRIGQLSRDALAVNQGSLYPALQGLKRRGWVKAEWRTSENNRRAAYYSITPVRPQAPREGRGTVARSDRRG